jgi:ketosteroid isomerase-like protein
LITHGNLSFGPDSLDRRTETTRAGVDGALAALETFYYALNNRDPDALAAVLAQHPLAQLNNPLGGILRGGDSILDLYAGKIFRGPVKVEVTFGDIVQYAGDRHVVFAGRETGTYTVEGEEPRVLSIRTSRYFRNDLDAGRWQQLHHHGSIDDAAMLGDYQRAVLG